MPNWAEVFIFEFDFEAKTAVKRSETPADSEQAARGEEENLVNRLNDSASVLATELQTELQSEVERVVRPFAPGPLAVQVEVAFRYEPDKSAEAYGIIQVLTAIGPFVSQVAAGALAPPLATLIGTGFQRIFRRWQQRARNAVLSSNWEL
jgi:hypothetical protein